MINSFKQYLVEEDKAVYFTFGRMNPPTVGHGKLLDKLAQAAGKNPYRVYLSQTTDAKKNPLDYNSKVKHVRKMFPKHARQVMINKNVRTAIDVLVALYDEGFRKVVMVVGSDRINEFDTLLNKYNGTKARHGFYNFESIKVVSAGERDPDAEGVEGMSASKQRENAANNDFVSFSQGLPASMSNTEARRLFNDVRKGMGLKEQTEFKNHIALKPVSEAREKFVAGELFELGDQVVVKESDEVGTVSVLGANYVILEMANGGRQRKWLDAVELIDEARAVTPKWKKAGRDGELEIKFPTGRRFKIEKHLDENERHKGEWKVLEYKTGGWVDDWEWMDTYKPKGYAKQRVMQMGQYDKKGKKVADYSATFQYESVQEASMYADKPDWGTPEATAKAKSMTPGQDVEEGSKGLWHNIHQRRKKGLRPLRPGEKGYPKTLDIEEQGEMERARERIARDKQQAKDMIAREKEKDKQKHDRILDAARRTVMLKKNKGVKP